MTLVHPKCGLQQNNFMPASSQKQANLFRAALGDPKPGTGAAKIKDTVPREKIKHFTKVGEGVTSKVGKNPFKIGDKVKLRDDVLQKHSKSVPAHMGYAREQFAWRKTLDGLLGKTGTISRLFDNSKHVNVKFDGTTIGIDYTDLVSDVADAGSVGEGTLETLGLSEGKLQKLKKILSPIIQEAVKEIRFSK